MRNILGNDYESAKKVSESGFVAKAKWKYIRKYIKMDIVVHFMQYKKALLLT